MAEKYLSYSFFEYPPTEILGTDIYLKSIKRLSFQYRTKDDDKLIAYIALSREQVPQNIPNIDKHMIGCRILGIYVTHNISKEYEVDNAILRMALLDEAEFCINGWVDSNDCNKFAFDYLWFYNKDIKEGEVIDELGDITTIDDISFKMVKRYNA